MPSSRQRRLELLNLLMHLLNFTGYGQVRVKLQAVEEARRLRRRKDISGACMGCQQAKAQAGTEEAISCCDSCRTLRKISLERLVIVARPHRRVALSTGLSCCPQLAMTGSTGGAADSARGGISKVQSSANESSLTPAGQVEALPGFSDVLCRSAPLNMSP